MIGLHEHESESVIRQMRESRLPSMLHKVVMSLVCRCENESKKMGSDIYAIKGIATVF